MQKKIPIIYKFPLPAARRQPKENWVTENSRDNPRFPFATADSSMSLRKILKPNKLPEADEIELPPVYLTGMQPTVKKSKESHHVEESTVRAFKKKYVNQLKLQGSSKVTSLEVKKHGRKFHF